ncbi:hypothetical protein PFISCL1PPCAC_9458, partial [Pristionchus fissidentatus]
IAALIKLLKAEGFGCKSCVPRANVASNRNVVVTRSLSAGKKITASKHPHYPRDMMVLCGTRAHP